MSWYVPLLFFELEHPPPLLLLDLLFPLLLLLPPLPPLLEVEKPVSASTTATRTTVSFTCCRTIGTSPLCCPSSVLRTGPVAGRPRDTVAHSVTGPDR